MSCRTYEDWKKKNRQVRQGETCAGRLIDGTPVFHKAQTDKRQQGGRWASVEGVGMAACRIYRGPSILEGAKVISSEADLSTHEPDYYITPDGKPHQEPHWDSSSDFSGPVWGSHQAVGILTINRRR